MVFEYVLILRTFCKNVMSQKLCTLSSTKFQCAGNNHELVCFYILTVPIQDCVFFQLLHDLRDVTNEVNSVAARLAIMEGRGDTFRSEMMRVMGMMDSNVRGHSKDIEAVKSVINTLVEDNVSMQGRMRLMQGGSTKRSSYYYVYQNIYFQS